MSNQSVNEIIHWSIDRNRDFNNFMHNQDDNNNRYNNTNSFTTWNPYSGEETITHIRNNYFNRANRRDRIHDINWQNIASQEHDSNVNNQTRYYETLNQIDNIIGIGENWVSSGYIPFNYVPNEDDNGNRNRRPTIDVSIQQMVFNEEERNCCICFETRENDDICKLNCDHVFCVDCLHEHLERNNNCPLCRTPIRSVRVQNNGAMETINQDV